MAQTTVAATAGIKVTYAVQLLLWVTTDHRPPRNRTRTTDLLATIAGEMTRMTTDPISALARPLASPIAVVRLPIPAGAQAVVVAAVADVIRHRSSTVARIPLTIARLVGIRVARSRGEVADADEFDMSSHLNTNTMIWKLWALFLRGGCS